MEQNKKLNRSTRWDLSDDPVHQELKLYSRIFITRKRNKETFTSNAFRLRSIKSGSNLSVGLFSHVYDACKTEHRKLMGLN